MSTESSVKEAGTPTDAEPDNTSAEENKSCPKEFTPVMTGKHYMCAANKVNLKCAYAFLLTTLAIYIVFLCFLEWKFDYFSGDDYSYEEDCVKTLEKEIDAQESSYEYERDKTKETEYSCTKKHTNSRNWYEVIFNLLPVKITVVIAPTGGVIITGRQVRRKSKARKDFLSAGAMVETTAKMSEDFAARIKFIICATDKLRNPCTCALLKCIICKKCKKKSCDCRGSCQKPSGGGNAPGTDTGTTQPDNGDNAPGDGTSQPSPTSGDSVNCCKKGGSCTKPTCDPCGCKKGGSCTKPACDPCGCKKGGSCTKPTCDPCGCKKGGSCTKPTCDPCDCKKGGSCSQGPEKTSDIIRSFADATHKSEEERYKLIGKIVDADMQVMKETAKVMAHIALKPCKRKCNCGLDCC